MHERDALRRELRSKRRRLTPQERAIKAKTLANTLLRTRAVNAAQHIACYLPMHGETDLRPFMHQARQRGKTIYLPVLARLGDATLRFVLFDAHSRLKANRFGIPEPQWRKTHAINAHKLDLVLTPLVGFDAQGNRLGMGGGYYDRSFAFRKRRQHWHKPLLIGCAYAFQEVEHLHREPWDVPLDGVITEQGFRLFATPAD